MRYIFRFLMLKWYCWLNGLMFNWFQSNEDKDLLVISITDRRNEHASSILIYMSKKPCKKMYKIYNRLRFMIYQKMIKKRIPIKKHIIDFGCYKLRSYY